MASQFFGMIWVCDCGYEWRSRNKTDYLHASRPKKEPQVWNWYDPFHERTALFRDFASLSGDQEDILAFAQKHGNIRCENNNWFKKAVEETRLDGWRKLIASMRHAVELSEKVRQGGGQDEQFQLMAHLSSSLANRISLRFDRLPNGEYVVRTMVYDLIDALWLQCALAIAEGRNYRACKLCGRFLELSPQRNRADKVFCSDNCRVKSFQRHRAKARRMRGEGKHLREIAKEVGANMQKVKKWVGEAE